MMMSTPKRPSYSGKTVTKSTPTSMFGNTGVSMPKQQAPARINTPRDHKCVVCPGSARTNPKY